MATSTYISGRKTYRRPQAMLWSDAPPETSNGFYVPSGFEVNAATAGSDFLILSDHNRKEISFKPERIEKRERMINGRMRSYHIADKMTISTSWDMLPSRAFSTNPNFDVSTGVSSLKNIITNSYFETNYDYWVPGDNASISRSTSIFYSGLGSLKISSTTADGNYWANSASPYSSVTANQTYTASAYVRSEVYASKVHICIDWLDASNNVTRSESQDFSITTSWRQVSLTANAPSNAVKAAITLRNFKVGTGNEATFWDNIEMTEKPTQYTVDGGAGGNELLDWYNNHTGSFYVFLAYDKKSNFVESGQYGHLAEYNEVIEMFISSFDYNVVKRGGANYDFWNVSVTLEEV